MIERIRGVCQTVFFAALLSAAVAIGQDATEYGPPNGTLVIAGGNVKDPAIYNRFIELAGGPNAKFVIVPTAGGNKTKDGKISTYEDCDSDSGEGSHPRTGTRKNADGR